MSKCKHITTLAVLSSVEPNKDSSMAVDPWDRKEMQITKEGETVKIQSAKKIRTDDKMRRAERVK